jgi:hypothetical protein
MPRITTSFQVESFLDRPRLSRRNQQVRCRTVFWPIKLDCEQGTNWLWLAYNDAREIREFTRTLPDVWDSVAGSRI